MTNASMSSMCGFEYTEVNKRMDRQSMLMGYVSKKVLSNIHMGEEVTFYEGFQTSTVCLRRGIVEYIHPEGRFIGIRLYGKERNEGKLEPWMTCAKPFEIKLDEKSDANKNLYNDVA